MNQEKIGKFIAMLRKEKKMTQYALGNIVDVSAKAVSKWECGVTLPDIGILIKLSETLGVTVTELLKGERIENITSQDVNDTIGQSVKFYQNKTASKLKKVVFVLIALVIFVSLILLIVFFVNNYNNCSLYSITSADEMYSVSGNIVITNNQKVLNINNISRRTAVFNELENFNKYKIFLIYNNKIIYKDVKENAGWLTPKNVINNIDIYIDDDITINKIIKNNINELQIIIELCSVSCDSSISIPLNVNRQFSNNHFLYK